MACEVADPADQWQRQVRYIEAELDPLNRLPVNLDALGDTLHDLIQI